MKPEAVEQYHKALRAGQRYFRNAVGRGGYPYPPALDEILDGGSVAGYADLGEVDIPARLFVGTRSTGRVSALAGNFMPLLGPNTEFAGKWMRLCDIQLSGEGIRDPVKCCEYMGKFYVQEGNKRVSVMLSLDAPAIAGLVTRVVPRYSDDPAVRMYYEFMWFYERSGLYGVDFTRPGDYARLQAALGFDEDHIWTVEERRSFQAGFSRFCAAFEKLGQNGGEVTAAEALLVWLQVFSFGELKEAAPAELAKRLAVLWPDVAARSAEDPIEVNTEPDGRSKGLLSRLLGAGHTERLGIAFIYAFDPAVSVWTRSHDHGRKYIQERMGDRVTVKVYAAYDRDYSAALERAVAEGARLIFATTPSMLGACRRTAALHGDVKILNCGLSQPYTGVRMYYSRIHECKFITGAIAGAMAENDAVGYVANYPIVGAPADINAFALGVRMTNPRARVRLVWSCTPGDPLLELAGHGIRVVSNRVAARPDHAHWALEWGVWKLRDDGEVMPLAVPCWNWGRLYEQIVLSVFSGAWSDISGSKAINYWWGFDSGVIDVQLSETLPEGVRSLAWILKNGVAGGTVAPFHTRITDQNGVLRNDGARSLSPEELIGMDWLCDNVDGAIPDFDTLLPMSRETVRQLGLHREQLPPEREERQL